MKTVNPVKKALSDRTITLGSWIQLGHPGIAEVLADTGFDWIAVDCEHTDIEIERFANIARGMYGRGPVPFARVKKNETMAIRQVLDAGAQGIIVPFVNTAEDARKAVAAAKYPPEGIRGFGFCRANDWGSNFAEYVQHANHDVAVVVMIESKEAVENIKKILLVEGIDGVFVGPYDMSGSYGVIGQTSHPTLIEACDTVVKACKQAGKAAGLHVVLPSTSAIERAISDGFTFIALGMDTVFLDQGARLALQIAHNMLLDAVH
jgi:2-keto-3-deoxy-L-rhamnonate aldolase RhmA